MELNESHDINLIIKAQIMRKFLEESKKITKENISWTSHGGLSLDNLLAHDK